MSTPFFEINGSVYPEGSGFQACIWLVNTNGEQVDIESYGEGETPTVAVTNAVDQLDFTVLYEKGTAG